jgi:hypothetical protein
MLQTYGSGGLAAVSYELVLLVHVVGALPGSACLAERWLCCMRMPLKGSANEVSPMIGGMAIAGLGQPTDTFCYCSNLWHRILVHERHSMIGTHVAWHAFVVSLAFVSARPWGGSDHDTT